MNKKIGKIKLELLKEEFIKQIKDSYTLNLSMVLLEEFENLQQENARLKDKIEKAKNFVDKYMDEWDFQDEVWKDMNDLLILFKEN